MNFWFPLLRIRLTGALWAPNFTESVVGAVPRLSCLSTSTQLPLNDQRASEMLHASCSFLEHCTKYISIYIGRGHILEDIVHSGLTYSRRVLEIMPAGDFDFARTTQICLRCQRARRWGQRILLNVSREAQ